MSVSTQMPSHYLDMRKSCFILLLLFSLCSCSSPWNRIADLFGVSVALQSHDDYKEERWVPFNGDGYKIVVYSVNDRVMPRISSIIKRNDFIPLNEPVVMKEYCGCQLDYIVSEGYLFCVEERGKSKETVFFDSEKRKIIYVIEIY